MSQNIEIKIISSLNTLELRQLVLRPNKSIRECQFDGDNLEGNFHFGLYLNNELVSIASLFAEPNPLFSTKNPYRLRGVATHFKQMNLGLGSKLMNFIIEFSNEKKIDFIWFNARIGALKFYEKFQFLYHGDEFIIPDVGPHKVMYKYL